MITVDKVQYEDKRSSTTKTDQNPKKRNKSRQRVTLRIAKNYFFDLYDIGSETV